MVILLAELMYDCAECGMQEQQQRGIPCSAVQWGAWSSVGMVAGSAAVLGRMRRAGVATVAPSNGLGVLAAVLAAGRPPTCLSAVPFLWTAFMACPERRRQPFFSEFLPLPSAYPGQRTDNQEWMRSFAEASAWGASDAQHQHQDQHQHQHLHQGQKTGGNQQHVVPQRQGTARRLERGTVMAAVAAAVAAALGEDVDPQAPLLQVEPLPCASCATPCRATKRSNQKP